MVVDRDPTSNESFETLETFVPPGPPGPWTQPQIGTRGCATGAGLAEDNLVTREPRNGGTTGHPSWLVDLEGVHRVEVIRREDLNARAE